MQDRRNRYLFFLAALAWSPVAMPPFTVAMLILSLVQVFTRVGAGQQRILYRVSGPMLLICGWMGDSRDGIQSWITREEDWGWRT